MNEMPVGFTDLSTPQDIELGFIATFLAHPGKIDRFAHVHPGMLSPVFGRVWEIMLRLSASDTTATAEVVAANIAGNGELAKALSGEDGNYRGWLSDATVMALPDNQVSAHADIIIDRWKRRQGVEVAGRLNGALADLESGETADDSLARYSKTLTDIIAHVGHNRVMSVEDIAADVSRSEAPFEYFSTGYPRLDNAMGGGLVAPGITVIEARPKCFKTGTLGSIAYQLAQARTRSAILSLEMPCKQIVLRMMAAEGVGNVRNYNSYPDRMRRESQYFAQKYTGLFDLYDLPNASLSKVQSTLWQAVERGNRVLFLDYFQLIRGCPLDMDLLGFREDMAGWMQGFVNETKTALVVAAQVGRSGETYGSDALNRNASYVGQIKFAAKHSERIDERRFYLDGRFSRHAALCDIGDDGDGPLSISDVGPILKIEDRWPDNPDRQKPSRKTGRV